MEGQNVTPNSVNEQQCCHPHHPHHGHWFMALSPILAAAVFGLALYLSVGLFKSYDRSVSVRGLCEREVKADRAIYPISFNTMGNDLSSLYGELEQQNSKVLAFLHENGISDDEISISAPSITDNYANSYSTNVRARYVIKSVITIYSSKIDTVLSIQSNLTKLIEDGVAVGIGESWENPVQFLFEGLNEIKPQMIEEANANARAAAEQFAKDSKSKVGKIRNATQGYFTIESRDSNTPQIKRVRVVTNVDFYLR